MHLVFISPRKHSLPLWTFFIPERRSRCDNLKHHQSQSQDRRTPSLILKFSWSKKERKIAFLSATLFSTPRLYKITSYSLKGGHSLEGTSLLWSPLPGKAMKATLLYFPKTMSPLTIRHGWTEAEFRQQVQNLKSPRWSDLPAVLSFGCFKRLSDILSYHLTQPAFSAG